jgi:ornithine cyclodeaminase/alanine dehydrogenase-like protein (mu-crystallin family)
MVRALAAAAPLLLYAGPEQVAATLSYPEAIDALEAAFADCRAGELPARIHLDVDDGELLLMPCHGAEGVGVKLVTLCPANPGLGMPFIHGLYVLFAAGSLAPCMVVDGAALTGVRTAAVSALVTRHLARPDSRRLAVFGAGVQAVHHVDAMRAVLPIDSVTITGRDPERARQLVDRLRADGLDASVAGPEAVADADVVCTCTTSAEALFAGDLVRPGTHINAVGAYRPDQRELDAALLARALVVVETRAAALAEAGDVLRGIGEGAFGEDVMAGELADVVCGRVARSAPDQITVFKSVGLALEDLAVAAALYRRLALSPAQLPRG